MFRGDLDPVDVHLLISAFCFFRVSNRHTFGAIFDRDLSDPKLRKRHKKMIIEAIERMLEVRHASGFTPSSSGMVPRSPRTVCTNRYGQHVPEERRPCLPRSRRFPSAAGSTPSCAPSPKPVSTASKLVENDLLT